MGGGSSIVSSSSSYTTLWSGSASGNNQSIILSDSYTNYDKIGFVCDADWLGAKRSYYREFDSAYFSYFNANGSGDDKLSICWGYGSAGDYVDFLLTTTSTQINFNANACSIKKVVGIKFGGGGSNITPSNSGEVYSTDETVIGTWVDGSTLYRKVFENPTNPLDTGLTSSNSVVVNHYGYVKDASVPTHYFRIPYADGGYSGGCWYDASNGRITMNNTGGSGFIYVYVVVEYTKT